MVKIGDGVSNWNTLAFSGGEYTEGDVAAAPRGTVVFWKDAANVLTSVSATKPLPVNIISGGGTVTGTVTANAGTNLNTSALALEATLLSVKTAVELLDNTVSGGETQVDIVAALPAGTNNIGDVDIASITAGDTVIGRVKLSDGVDVADILDLANSNPLTVAIVDAAGTQITSFGGGTQYTEDVAAAADPVGTAPILVRSDTPSAIVTTNGDNVAQRGTNYGAAYTQIVSSAGAFIDTFGGGTQYTEDVAATADPVGNQLIARRRDSLATETTTDGDNTAVNSTGKGELYVKHVDAIPVTDNAGSLTVDAPVGTPAFVRLSDGAAAISTLPVSLATLPQVDTTKTVGTSVMALQTVAASSVAISSVIDTGSKLGATIFVHFGREAVTAAGAGVNIRIEGSSRASLNGHWYPLATFTTGFATSETEPLTATEPAGETVIAVASTTNLTAGELVFIFNTTVANSEWVRIKSVSAGASVTIEDGLLFEQTAAASDIFDLAEMFVAQLDLTAVGRLRVVADGSNFTQAFAIEVDMITFDSIG